MLYKEEGRSIPSHTKFLWSRQISLLIGTREDHCLVLTPEDLGEPGSASGRWQVVAYQRRGMRSSTAGGSASVAGWSEASLARLEGGNTYLPYTSFWSTYLHLCVTSFLLNSSLFVNFQTKSVDENVLQKTQGHFVERGFDSCCPQMDQAPFISSPFWKLNGPLMAS